jgi:hypothetical protein
MLVVALALFLVGGSVGLSMAVRHFVGARPHLPSALIHGAINATGLVLVLIAVLAAGIPAIPTAALGCLLLAAAGGFVNFARHLGDSPLYGALIVVHAVLALTGVSLIAWAVLEPWL